MKILMVAAGAAIGAVARYLITVMLQAGRVFPVGTLVVNIIGCFVIGALAQWYELRGGGSELTRLFVMTGVLGGFTTFSAFANETALLVRDDRMSMAFANIALHFVVALGSVWLGRICTSLLIR